MSKKHSQDHSRKKLWPMNIRPSCQIKAKRTSLTPNESLRPITK